MFGKMKMHISVISLIIFTMPFMAFAQKVGVFFDSNVTQIKFAAGDVKTALELKGFTVEMLPITSLKSSYAQKKVVIVLSSNAEVTKLLLSEGGAIPTGLDEQAYGLRTTKKGQLSYWVLGGDASGAMYGGLEIAENIKFRGFAGVYNNQESPTILKRGIKLNLPFDVNSTTYFNANISTSSKNAIANIWDMDFWKTWFDDMARNRYNVLSVWNNHAFTSMIKLPEYPDVVINDVTGYPDIHNDSDKKGAVIKKMTIDQKIEFWRNVMAYAKSRGFTFYLFNWNLFLGTANEKYGMTEGKSGVTNQATITYLRKCMYELLKTYPDLDGFGVTQGEPTRTVAIDFSQSGSLRAGLAIPDGLLLFTPQNSDFGSYLGAESMNLSKINSSFDLALEILDIPLQTFQGNSSRNQLGSRQNVVCYFRPEQSNVGTNSYIYDSLAYQWLDIAISYPVNLSSLSFRVYNPYTGQNLVASNLTFNLMISDLAY